MAEGGRTGGSSMSPAKWVPYVRPSGEGRGRERVLGRTGREVGGGGAPWRERAGARGERDGREKREGLHFPGSLAFSKAA